MRRAWCRGALAYPVWLIALVICVCVAGLSLYARRGVCRELSTRAESGQLTTSAMQPDHFYSFGASLVLSAASIDRAGDLMHGVFVETKDAENVRVIRSESGRIFGADETSRQRIELQNGISYSISEGSRADRTSEFEGLVYYAASEPISDVQNKRRASPTVDLVTATAPKSARSCNGACACPVIAFFMALIAVEISRALPGSSPYPRFVAGIVVYAVVFNVARQVEHGSRTDRSADTRHALGAIATALLFVAVRQLPAVSLRRPG